jgi:hypothetical protein
MLMTVHASDRADMPLPAFAGTIAGRQVDLVGSLHRIGSGDEPEDDCFVLRLDANEPELAWFWLEVRWDPMAFPPSAICALVESCPVVVKGRVTEKSRPPGKPSSNGGADFVVKECGQGGGLRITHAALDAGEFEVTLAVGMTGPSSLRQLC